MRIVVIAVSGAVLSLAACGQKSDVAAVDAVAVATPPPPAAAD